MENNRKKWTPKDDAKLKASYAKRPVKEVAGEMGRTVDSVYERARHLNIRKMVTSPRVKSKVACSESSIPASAPGAQTSSVLEITPWIIAVVAIVIAIVAGAK